MSKLAELPDALREAVEAASERVDADRAMIALQGIVHAYQPLQIIDGVLRNETIVAVRVTAVKIGLDRLVEIYQQKIADRFPVAVQANEIEASAITAEEIQNEVVAESDLFTVVPAKKRRRS